MIDFGFAVLMIFIIIRVLIAVGLFYLIIVEVRRYKKRRPEDDQEIKKNENGKDADGSVGSRK